IKNGNSEITTGFEVPRSVSPTHSAIRLASKNRFGHVVTGSPSPSTRPCSSRTNCLSEHTPPFLLHFGGGRFGRTGLNGHSKLLYGADESSRNRSGGSPLKSKPYSSPVP